MNNFTNRLNRSLAANIKWYIDNVPHMNPAGPPLRAAGLVQTTTGDPLEVQPQHHEINRFAARRGIIVIRTFVAPGEAGGHTTPMNIISAMSGPDSFELLLITDRARLGRHADDIYSFLRLCRDADLVIVTVRDGFVL